MKYLDHPPYAAPPSFVLVIVFLQFELFVVFGAVQLDAADARRTARDLCNASLLAEHRAGQLTL